VWIPTILALLPKPAILITNYNRAAQTASTINPRRRNMTLAELQERWATADHAELAGSPAFEDTQATKDDSHDSSPIQCPEGD